jgi:uncharacterized membrane protein
MTELRVKSHPHLLRISLTQCVIYTTKVILDLNMCSSQDIGGGVFFHLLLKSAKEIMLTYSYEINSYLFIYFYTKDIHE